MAETVTMKEKLDQMISELDPDVQGLVRFAIDIERKYQGEKYARIPTEIRAFIDKAAKAELEGR